MTSDLQWLHLSDVHVSHTDSYDHDVVLGALLNSLPILAKRGLAPDAIFFTGDIGTTGKCDEYKAATAFFDNLLDVTGLGKQYLFVVPGNHDVDRTKKLGLLRTLESQDQSNDYFCLGKPILHLAYGQEAFVNWYNEYFDGIRRFEINNTCGPYEVMNIRNTSLGIIPINSAVFCAADDDAGNLWIGRKCLDRCLDGVRERADLTVAMLHHPLEYLHESERIQITTRLRESCDAILRGHLHQTEAEQTRGSAGNGISLAAGATYQGSKWPNKASFVSLSRGSLRVTPIRYNNEPSPTWTIDPSIFPTADDYVGEFLIARSSEVSEAQVGAEDAPAVLALPVLEHPKASAADATSEAAARKAFEHDLFVGPSGKPLYAEPYLAGAPQAQVDLSEDKPPRVTIEQVVGSAESYVIKVMQEYGGTSLSKRLLVEFLQQDVRASLEDARELPNYRAKLKDRFESHPSPPSPGSVIILDNFNRRHHEKLIKEIQSLNCFERYIVIETTSRIQPDDPPPVIGASHAIVVFLWSMGRAGIRSIAQNLFDTSDDVFVSAAVNKVYSDLLTLSIPLSPSNVVMYLKVLHQEYDFHPFNRVDIVQKYLTSALSRPSELMTGSFAAREKLDILSEFCHKIAEEKADCFTDIQWLKFCESYIESTLTNFSPKQLLEDLELSRLVARFDGKLYFRYSFYFSFLVGRHIASKTNLIVDFLSGADLYALPGVIETISALSGEGNLILDHVASDLEFKIKEFGSEFIPSDFDPLSKAEWALGEGSEDEMWERISHEVEEGPVPPEELDLIRTSLRLEARSQDQEVRYAQMKKLEVDVFRTAYMLAEALKASHGVKGEIKKRCVINFLQTHVMGMQIGTILAKEMVGREWIQWGGIVFIGFQTLKAAQEDDSLTELRIVSNLPCAVSVKAADDVGSRKLGEVFKACASDTDPESFLSLLLFSCILESKPEKWEVSLLDRINLIGTKSFFLSKMLSLLMLDFKRGINTQYDRQSLKKLIATIHAKRARGAATPSSRMVRETLAELEKQGALSSDPSGLKPKLISKMRYQ